MKRVDSVSNPQIVILNAVKNPCAQRLNVIPQRASASGGISRRNGNSAMLAAAKRFLWSAAPPDGMTFKRCAQGYRTARNDEIA